MNRPVGLLLVVIWCLLRGAFGTYGAIRLVPAVVRLHGSPVTWRDVLLVFLIEGAIWLWLAFALASRWNVGRWVAVLWCAITIALSSRGVYVAIQSKLVPAWYVYVLTVAIHGAIIIYLLRPAVTRLFRPPERSVA